MFKRAVKWWCIKKDLEKRSAEESTTLRRDASLNHIYDIYNKEGLTVLALSLKYGAWEVISRLLMMFGVTKYEIESNKHLFKFNVSQLMPRTNGDRGDICG